jgi:hypothetical protein
LSDVPRNSRNLEDWDWNFAAGGSSKPFQSRRIDRNSSNPAANPQGSILNQTANYNSTQYLATSSQSGKLHSTDLDGICLRICLIEYSWKSSSGAICFARGKPTYSAQWNRRKNQSIRFTADIRFNNRPTRDREALLSFGQQRACHYPRID